MAAPAESFFFFSFFFKGTTKYNISSYMMMLAIPFNIRATEKT